MGWSSTRIASDAVKIVKYHVQFTIIARNMMKIVLTFKRVVDLNQKPIPQGLLIRSKK